MMSEAFYEVCRRSGNVDLEDGAQLAAEWGQERDAVEATFHANPTLMRSWFLGEQELASLKIEPEDLFELPAWQLMGLVVRHESGAAIVRRLVLMVDHARVMSSLDGDFDAARLWEMERDRCLLAAGFSNVVYCLVLNTQMYYEHQEFLRLV